MTEQLGDYKSQISACGNGSGRDQLRGTTSRKIRKPEIKHVDATVIMRIR